MTRFDAAKRFGGLLTVLQEECLEFSAMSCGPEIGNRLKSATPENLVLALNKYLPDIMATSSASSGVSSSQVPKTVVPVTANANLTQPINTHKAQAELPAWVKGINGG